ncbi:MAG: FAD-binding domain-containing protein [Notoacmeibacter sp.]
MDLLTRTADFTPTREAALARLAAFLPNAGTKYADKRNFDFGPDDRSNISALSPHIRHRLISEHEVCAEVLKVFAPSTAEKFIQEVFWRTYWKGWLEMRPQLWSRYNAEVDEALTLVNRNSGLRKIYEQAVEGRTGNEAFDAWALELIETGYLHNHARMWFASIWIFTLRLPWQLGADFFYRHLMDGDSASNTCSWRWVAGLHTRGKTYLARASNIAEYTQGRFRPDGLAREANPLEWDNPPSASHLKFETAPGKKTSLLLVTEEDCNPIVPENAAGFVTWNLTSERSTLPVGDKAKAFAEGALTDARLRLEKSLPCFGVFVGLDAAKAVLNEAQNAAAIEIIVMRPPVGPAADAVNILETIAAKHEIMISRPAREWDRLAWPYAAKGFFNLKECIPTLLELNHLS